MRPTRRLACRCSGLLRVVQDELARDVGAIAPARIIDARDPVVRPARRLLACASDRVLPECLRVAAGVDVEEEWTDDLGPVLAFADRDGSPAVVAASPVVEDAGGGNLRRVAMAEELDLGRTAAEVFEARVDEPEAEVLRGARPAVNGVVVLHGRVDILVALVEVGGEGPVAPGVDGHPVERVGELGAVAGLGHRGRRIVRLMLEGAVRVYPRIVAAEGVANLDVGGKVAALSGARAVSHLDAARDSLDGNLATLAAVGPGIDGHAGDRLLAAGRIVRPVAARVSGPVVERLGTLVLERRQVAGSFRHAGGDDPIRKRERRGIVVDGDGLAEGIFPSRQERRKRDREVDCGSQSHAAGRTGRPGHGGRSSFGTVPSV